MSAPNTASKRHLPTIEQALGVNPVFAHLTPSEKQEVADIDAYLRSFAGRFDRMPEGGVRKLIDKLPNQNVRAALIANMALVEELEQSGGRYRPFADRIDLEGIRDAMDPATKAIADQFRTEEITEGVVEARKGRYREDDIPINPDVSLRDYVEHASLDHALRTGTKPIHDVQPPPEKEHSPFSRGKEVELSFLEAAAQSFLPGEAIAAGHSVPITPDPGEPGSLRSTIVAAINGTE